MLKTMMRAMLLALGLVVTVDGAAAGTKELLARVPSDANALVVIDVAKLLGSPIGLREGWREKLASAYGEKPIVILPTTTRVVMAARIAPGGEGAAWEVSVMELSDTPSIENIARAERGYVDKLGEKLAAWSPINAYFVQLEPQVLGAVTPANRQFAARWARQKPEPGGSFWSEYLRLAAAAVDQGTELVMAIDLEDMTSAARIERRLREEPFESLVGREADAPALAKLLASMRGLTLKIEVGEDIVGRGVIEFGADVTPLGDLAKPLLLEVLGKEGMNLPDFETWELTLRGRNLTVQGKLSVEGLRNLLSIVDPPAPAQAIAVAAAQSAAPTPAEGEPPTNPTPSPTPPAGPDAMATASQKYYETIAKMLDRLEKNIGSGAKAVSLGESSAWLKRDARRIDRLPILNVDPDLVAWGAAVSSSLREVGGLFDVGSMQTRGRNAGIMNSYSYDPYNYDEGGQSTVDRINTDGQRRAAAQQEKTTAYGNAKEVLDRVRGSRAQIRAEMTKRYGIEF